MILINFLSYILLPVPGNQCSYAKSLLWLILFNNKVQFLYKCWIPLRICGNTNFQSSTSENHNFHSSEILLDLPKWISKRIIFFTPLSLFFFSFLSIRIFRNLEENVLWMISAWKEILQASILTAVDMSYWLKSIFNQSSSNNLEHTGNSKIKQDIQ